MTFLVLVCPVLLDRGGDSMRLGWFPSILTWRVLFDKGEVSKWLE